MTDRFPWKRAGFVGTRFAGTDGVSLETTKWARVLQALGIEAVYFSGLSDLPREISWVTPRAFFDHPEIASLQRLCFGKNQHRTPETTEALWRIARELKDELYRFREVLAPDFLVIENALAIPMNVPLGLAITEFIAETGIPAVAHHHDFAWERDRFRVSAVQDLLHLAFPPDLPSLRHAVINREAQRQLGLRRGVTAPVVPNVFDFSLPTPGPDEYNSDLRESLGIGPDQLVLLQPTRIIARKGIEHALELAARLAHRNPLFVVPHHEYDEGDEYTRRICEYAEQLGVSLMLRPDRIGLDRGTTAQGEKIYSLWDLYVQADFVTYPSLYEGFGNAFVEAVFFGKPLLVNRYSVYREDIEPLGFQAVTIEGYLTQAAVEEVEALLDNPGEQERRARRNRDIATRYFSRDLLERKIRGLLEELPRG
ncbi:Glycosyltransferase involved in cell wall bisynthesis [Alkalispirochaeta americana]|uniref:Glycosyltransferase involved in cell wall bisynthesis n=1 Tax=Alkalispirochaeta americana TaxID=159291 RepID=A0A1N6WLR5_9SPIO|nr:glycosyltransferase family 4 protein [Alkalispirochaeta americana]SIQ91043.1 Glycosyltransferase involved in cell wall bisynthesis [Alkalispirochaeta americana]